MLRSALRTELYHTWRLIAKAKAKVRMPTTLPVVEMGLSSQESMTGQADVSMMLKFQADSNNGNVAIF